MLISSNPLTTPGANKKLDEVRDILKHQKLDRFLKLDGNLYPDSVKFLFTNLSFDGDGMYYHVKGVDMTINDEVWLVVAGLRNDGKSVCKGNTYGLDDFNYV